MMPTFPPFLAAASTAAKCSGIFACVSKLSTTLKFSANSGVCVGRSVALPPQRTKTSNLPLCDKISSALNTGAPHVFISLGFLRLKTAESSKSLLFLAASSTPRPKFPYPKTAIFIFSLISYPFIFKFLRIKQCAAV